MRHDLIKRSLKVIHGYSLALCLRKFLDVDRRLLFLHGDIDAILGKCLVAGNSFH